MTSMLSWQVREEPEKVSSSCKKKKYCSRRSLGGMLPAATNTNIVELTISEVAGWDWCLEVNKMASQAPIEVEED